MPSVIGAAHYKTNNSYTFPSGLKAECFVLDPKVHVHGDTSTETLMRTMLVVPVVVERNLPSDSFLTQWDKDTSGAFVI